jgi:beta-glucosidase/6-phospho-beta-glucosidase/beta-galactosidase
MSNRPRILATLDGYSVEGGFDRPYEPATCYSPTIALGRHDGPGDADRLWHDYEKVLDLVPSLGIDGVRITTEWARIEPRRNEVSTEALDRYAAVCSYAKSLGLYVSVALVDAAWPSWAGMEAWLLPWVAPYCEENAVRVVTHLGDSVDSVVLFSEPEAIVTRGFVDALSPPWRSSASKDAALAIEQIDDITAAIASHEVVAKKLVSSSTLVSLDAVYSALTSEETYEEIYVQSLVRGSGPTASQLGLLSKHNGVWSVSASEELLETLR